MFGVISAPRDLLLSIIVIVVVVVVIIIVIIIIIIIIIIISDGCRYVRHKAQTATLHYTREPAD